MRRQFEESEDEFLNEGKSTAGKTKEHFILHQEEIKTEQEGKRKRGRKRSKVRERGERRKRKKGARQVKKEKEQMRLSGYTCSLWFCEVCVLFVYTKHSKSKRCHTNLSVLAVSIDLGVQTALRH